VGSSLDLGPGPLPDGGCSDQTQYEPQMSVASRKLLPLLPHFQRRGDEVSTPSCLERHLEASSSCQL
jgi:hypothetical protein